MSQKKHIALHLQLNIHRQTIASPKEPLVEGREARRAADRILRRQKNKQPQKKDAP